MFLPLLQEGRERVRRERESKGNKRKGEGKEGRGESAMSVHVATQRTALYHAVMTTIRDCRLTLLIGSCIKRSPFFTELLRSCRRDSASVSVSGKREERGKREGKREGGGGRGVEDVKM